MRTNGWNELNMQGDDARGGSFACFCPLAFSCKYLYDKYLDNGVAVIYNEEHENYSRKVINRGDFMSEYFDIGTNKNDVMQKGENIISGIVGAFLFSIIGAITWFVIYQIGYISGIAGIITVVCAEKGYEIFGNASSKKGIAIAVLVSLFMIFVAQWSAYSYEVYKIFHVEYNISFFDAVSQLPNFFQDAAFKRAFIGELIIGYGLMAVAVLFEFLASIRKPSTKERVKHKKIYDDHNQFNPENNVKYKEYEYESYNMQNSSESKYDLPNRENIFSNDYNQTKVNMFNGNCVAGFVLGLLSIVLFLIPFIPILAIIYSSIGLQKLKTRDQKGRGLAVWGLVFGLLFIVLSIGFWILVIREMQGV